LAVVHIGNFFLFKNEDKWRIFDSELQRKINELRKGSNLRPEKMTVTTFQNLQLPDSQS